MPHHRLRVARTRKNLSIEKTAQLSGISSARLYRIERGLDPRISEIRALCQCLDISADWWLLGRSASDEVVGALTSGLSPEVLRLALHHVQKRLAEGEN